MLQLCFLLTRAALLVLGLASLSACGAETNSPVEQRFELGDGPAPGLEVHSQNYSALAIPTTAPRVIFLGDSISAGLHLTAEEAFPAVLQRNLHRNGLPFHLINAGISGDTTAGGLARIDWLLQQDPDVLVLELGVNDGLRGVSTAEIETNLREIIRKTREADVKVLLLGHRIPPSYGEDYSEAIAELYPKLAQEYNLAFVPFFMEGVAGETTLTLPDGLHPTEPGHRLLAENVAPALTKLLERFEHP